MAASWSELMLSKLVGRCNNFFQPGSSRAMCKPFLVDGQQVGWVWPGVEKHIQRFADVFMVEEKQVSLCPSLQTYEERTKRVQEVMLRLRQEGDFIALKGWRDEMYEVFHQQSSPPVFRMERTATALLGVKQYGVHVNGYVEHPQKGPLMWIGRRAKNKSTYPNKLDQVTAGGFTAGLTAQEVLVKECAEEANIPQDIALTAQPAGAISYFYEDERGLFPEIQFVFDLKLPLDFQPVNTDGEVSEFYLWDMDKVKEQIAQPDFKPNCAMVVLDFLIRHGHIHPDQEPRYLQFLENLHKTLF
ncbi:uncharacterized protein LOC144872827 [Branchiostoma floridae x Branchiostoma japonicum]